MYRIMANPRKQLPEREHLQYYTAIMFYDQGRGERGEGGVLFAGGRK